MAGKPFHLTWRSPVTGAALIIVLTALAYIPTLRSGFVFDDVALITDNRTVKASDGLYRFWFTGAADPYYPLSWSLWWSEWHLWDGRAVGYHVVNVALHAVNAILVWMILRRLKVPGAWLAAMVFAIHPVNVATVAWVSEQKNTLSMFFFTLSILCYLRFDDDVSASPPYRDVGRDAVHRIHGHAGAQPYQRLPWIWYGLSLAAFLLALLSKTAVVMLPVVLLGCVWWQHGRLRRNDWLCSAPFFLTSLVMAVVTIVQHQRVMGETVVLTGGFAARLAAAGRVPWFYLSKALLPVNLTVIYPQWEIDPTHWISYIPAALWLGAFLVFWWKRRTWGRPLLFGFGYFVATLFPVLGFFEQAFYQFSLVADHWQYYSIVGVIALAVAAGQKTGDRLGKWGSFVTILASVAILVVLGVATWRRGGIYLDEETLWRDNVAKNPAAWAAHNNLGCALERRGDPGDAVRQFELALQIDPRLPHTHNNLGNALRQTGRLPEAVSHLEQALQLEPDYAEAHMNLGLALMSAGKIQDAIGHYERAVQLGPDDAYARCNLGSALMRLGRLQEAIGQYEQALHVKPDYAEAYANLGVALQQNGRWEEAIGCYQQALRLKPDSAETHNNLAVALQRSGKLNDAIAHYEQGLRLKPDSAEAHNNLGVALQQAGRVPEAIAQYQQALRLKPDYAEVHNKLGNAFLQAGKFKEAIAQYEQALRSVPDLAEAQNNLAWLLATLTPAEGGDPARAVTLAERVCQLGGEKDPSQLDTLAVSYAAAGRFDDAIIASEKAIALARGAGQTELLKALEVRLQLYRDGRPYLPSVNSATSHNP